MITVTALNSNFSEVPTGEIDMSLDAFVRKHSLNANNGVYSAEWGNGEGSDDFEIVETSISTAFEAFMADTKAVEGAIDSSTSASHGGGSYKLELFSDGTYRVLSQVGNLYDSTGIIISIPALRDDDMAPIDDDGNELASAFYDNAIEELRRNFEYAVSES